MKTPPPHHIVREQTSTAYGWLNPEAAMRHALSAFYQTCRYADHIRRTDDSDLRPQEWAEEFAQVFSWKLAVAAADSGAAPAEYATDARHYLNNYTEAAWLETYRQAEREIVADRENLRDIHCRDSHNGNSSR
jgi:truncated hemoglobin YjbI